MAKKTIKSTTPEATNRADELTANSVTSSIASTRTEIEALLSSLTDKTLAGLRSYEEIKAAIAAKQDELDALYSKETAAADLTSLSASIEAARMIASKEATERARTREAEEAAWRHGFSQKKLAEQALYDDEKRQQKRLDEQREYEKNLGWKRREDAIAAAEQELKSLREQAASFEARVKTEAERQTAIATNALKKSYEHEKALADLSAKADATRMTDRILNLEASLRSKDSEIAKLQHQLVQAAGRNQAATVRAALDATSGKQALAEVQQVVATTANNKK